MSFENYSSGVTAWIFTRCATIPKWRMEGDLFPYFDSVRRDMANSKELVRCLWTEAKWGYLTVKEKRAASHDRPTATATYIPSPLTDGKRTKERRRGSECTAYMTTLENCKVQLCEHHFLFLLLCQPWGLACRPVGCVRFSKTGFDL